MKKKFLLLMALCFCAFTNKALAWTGDGINIPWDISDYSAGGNNVTATLSGNTLTISGTGNMADFLYSLEGQTPWREAGLCSEINTVVIGDGVTNIGDVAFQDCGNLQKINIPGNVKIIGTRSFENCTSLSAVSIPSSVATIEDGAFTNCTGLTAIADMATAPQSVNPNVFDGISNLNAIYLAVPVKSIPSYQSASVWSGFNVKAPYFLLSENSTNDIVVGLDGALYFYEYQNANPNLPQRVTIVDGVSDTVKMIVNYDAQGLPAKITTNGSVILLDGYNGDNFSACVTSANGETHEYNNLTVSGLSLYTNSGATNISGFERANIELGLAGCMLSGFEGNLDVIGCSSTLNEITETYLSFSIMTPQLASQLGIISNVMTVITCASVLVGDIAGIPGCLIGGAQMIIDLFNGNNGNNGIISSGCNNVSWSLNGGTLVISGDDAFSCSSYPWTDRANEITTLVIGSGVTTIPATFGYYGNLQNVIIEDGSNTLYFENGISFAYNSIESFYLGRNISYSSSPFYYNTGIASLTIGNQVTSIGAYCFNDCSGLNSVTFSNSLTSIGNNAFSGCNALTSVTFGNGLISIGDNAFGGCRSITSPLNIPLGVKTIGNYAFYDCENAPTLIIPISVDSIGCAAFSYCISLQSVTIEDGNEPLTFGYSNGTGTFANSSIGALYLGRQISYSNDDSPFSENKLLTSLEIGSNVTSIDDYAFSGCTGLSQITSNPTTPPALQANTFSGVKTDIPIYIDCNYLTDYQSVQYWSDFTNYMCPLSNDQCADASALSCGTSVQGSLAHATPTTSVIYDDGADRGDVFYQFTADIAGDYSVTLTKHNIDDDINLYVYSDCDAATPLVKLIDAEDGLIETKTLENCTAGTTYFLRAIDWSYSGGSFDILLTCSTNTWQIGYPNAADVTATFDNGTLTISGTGAMQDWGWGGNGELPPWKNIKDNITNIIIEDGITTIGFYAFIDCTNAVSVNIGKDVSEIKIDAFWNCPALMKIHCNNSTPPVVDDNAGDAFWNLNRAACKLYVPSGSEDAYKSADVWKDFNIQTTGIIDVDASTFSIFPNPVKDEIFIKSELQIKKVEICDISGRIVETRHATSLPGGVQKIAVSALSQGIYIVRIYTDSGLIVSKIMKK